MEKTRTPSNIEAYFCSRRAITAPLSPSVGDRVAYTRYFLKATGEPPTGSRWHDRGTILEVREPFVLVQWEGHDEPVHVSPVNLAHPGASSRFGF